MVGKATQKPRDIYQQCWDWLRTSIEAVRPGTTTAEMAARCPTAPEFGYKDEKEAFEENTVFALETWFGETDGFDGARIEEECVLTKNGCAVIGKCPCSDLVEAAA